MSSATNTTAGSEFLSDLPELAYLRSITESHRKKFGQFFTPVPVARFMAGWVAANTRCRSILDPAVGLGVFFRVLQAEFGATQFEFTGYDSDKAVISNCKELFGKLGCQNVELIEGDYLLNDWENCYDGIICNPPYFRFQSYENRPARLQELQSRLGISLSGFSNIYSLFILISLKQLSRGGRAAFITPTEFLNADYGVPVKKYIREGGMLRYVIVLDGDKGVFEGALTTSCILLFANDEQADGVTFMRLSSGEELPSLGTTFLSYPRAVVAGATVPYSELDPSKKWRSYYQESKSSQYRHLVPLSTYGKVVRGIATGDNSYFTFNTEKKRLYKLSDACFEPCITKASHVTSPFLTADHFARLRDAGKKVFLFDGQKCDDQTAQSYISVGERLGVNKRYLTRHRNPWYLIEQRPPAPILVTVFNRGRLRFVRNEAGVRNLTCFHCFYPNIFAASCVDILMAYLVTDIATEIMSDERREYGGGLKKFEPNDLNKASVIDLSLLDAETEELILKTFGEYRTSSLESGDCVSPQRKLNEIFLRIL